VSRSTGLPGSSPVRARSIRLRSPFAHRGRLGAAVPVRQHGGGALLGQRRPRRLALRLVDSGRRAMRRTDFCQSPVLRTSTRASWALVASSDCTLAHTRSLPASRSGRLASAGLVASRRTRRGGRCLPVAAHADRASDTPVASLTSATPLARTWASVRAAKIARDRTRVNGAMLQRSGVPSIAQGPSPRDALSSARLRTSSTSWLGRRDLVSRRLLTPADPRERTAGSQAPVHAPRCQREARLSGPRRSLPTSATIFDARAHQTSVRPSHASGARESRAPLLAGTNGCRLRRPSGALPRRWPASHDSAREGFRQSRSTRVEEGIAGRSVRARRARASSTNRACPPRSAPGTRVAGSRCPRAGAPRASSLRPRPPSDDAPRRAAPSKEPGCLSSRRDPYASGGWLLRARPDRSPFTPPPERHCSGAHALFSPPPRRLPLTSEAPEAARPPEPRSRSSLVRQGDAPTTTSTTESARGQMCQVTRFPALLTTGMHGTEHCNRKRRTFAS